MTIVDDDQVDFIQGATTVRVCIRGGRSGSTSNTIRKSGDL